MLKRRPAIAMRRAAIVFIAFIFALQPLQALAIDQRFYSSNDILYWNEDACKVDSASSSGVAITGDNAKDIWNFLIGKGLSEKQAAGIMGNFREESGPDFDPGIQEQGNGGAGYGIGQWSYGRRDALERAARKKGVSASSLAFQLEFLYQEMNSRQAIDGGGSEWEVIQRKNTIKEATLFFHKSFERSGDDASQILERVKSANIVYDNRDNLTAKTAGASSGGSKQTIFLDPGHGGAISSYTDKKSGLKTAESHNMPETKDALDVANRVKAQLEQIGYNVVMSRTNNDQKVTFRQRADAAAKANAAIGISIHTTPGDINEAWPQRVDTFREYNGHRDTFGDTDQEKTTAATSGSYASIFAKTRSAAEGHTVTTDPGNETQSGSFHRDGIASKGNIPLIALWSPTVPWVYNEIAQNTPNHGISNDRKAAYAKGIIEGVQQAVPPTSDNTCDDSSFTSGNLAQTILAYAWPTHHDAPYTKKKPAYATAVQQAQKDGRYVGGLQYPGVDCGGFVTTLMVDSKFEPDYNHGGKLSQGAGTTEMQQAWAEQHWKKLGSGSSINPADLQQGDVAFSPGHTFVYAGEIPGFHSKIASASVSFSGLNWRSPMAGEESPINPLVTWYRKK